MLFKQAMAAALAGLSIARGSAAGFARQSSIRAYGRRRPGKAGGKAAWR